MGSFEIITNNPTVAAAYPESAKFYDVSVLEIFTIVRDMVHRGAKVLSHPLSGSVKPWETPYKSIMVSCPGGSLDFESLKYIENAIGMMKNREVSNHSYSAEALEDFGVIDLSLMQTIKGI